jgi:transposase
MPRAQKDLSPWRTEILELYDSNTTQTELIAWLQRQHNISISLRHLRKYLKEWKGSKRKQSDTSEELRLRIQALFYEACLKDKEMVFILKQEGFQIEQRRLARIRADLGLYKRVQGCSAIEEDERVYNILQQELNHSTINRYGKSFLYTAIRRKGYIASRSVSVLFE